MGKTALLHHRGYVTYGTKQDLLVLSWTEPDLVGLGRTGFVTGPRKRMMPGSAEATDKTSESLTNPRFCHLGRPIRPSPSRFRKLSKTGGHAVTLDTYACKAAPGFPLNCAKGKHTVSSTIYGVTGAAQGIAVCFTLRGFS